MPLDLTDTPRTLAELAHGDGGTVLEIDPSDHHLLARLAARGLVPGARVSILRAGDPLLIRIEKTKWAINRCDAAQIVIGLDPRRRPLLARLRIR